MKFSAVLLALVFCVSAQAKPKKKHAPKDCTMEVLTSDHKDVAGLPCADPPAKPKRYVADWKFWTVNAANIGFDIATSLTINKCMKDHGIGPCWGGDYGPFAAKEAIRGGFSSAALPISYFWKRQDAEQGKKHSLWWLIPLIPMGINSGTIIRNATTHYGAREVEAAHAAARNYEIR